MNILAYVIQVLTVLPELIAAGVEITGFVNKQREKVEELTNERRDPTADEWNALNAEIDRLREELHAPGNSDD